MSETGLAPLTREEADAYLLLANRAADEKIALTEQGMRENSKFASTVTGTQIPRSTWMRASGQFSIASAFIHTWIASNPTLDFENGQKLKFSADVWGIGLGGGVVWLTGVCAPPAELVGEVGFVLQTNPVHTEIAFTKNGNPAGVLIGGGINTQIGVFGGTGNFSWA
jgi:hypothetical protein